MELIKAIIVDDKALGIEVIKEYLSCYPDFEIVAECQNYLAARKDILHHKPDVVFLDIDLDSPEGSGIDLVTELEPQRSIASIIIFMTRFDRKFGGVYAKEVGIRFSTAFLPKPISPRQIDKTITEIRHILSQRKNTKSYFDNNLISIKDGRNTYYVKPEDVFYAETLDTPNYISVKILSRAKKLTLQYSITKFMNDVLRSDMFFKVGGGKMINLEYLTQTTQNRGKYSCLIRSEDFDEEKVFDISQKMYSKLSNIQR